MDLDDIRRLIDTLIEKQVDEFELQEGDRRIHIKRAGASPSVTYVTAPAVPVGAPAAPAAPAPKAAGEPEPAAEEDLFIVRSPIVGTFYESPSPGAPEFVKVGDFVDVGQVLCIIEAMKLMNEIEAEVAGQIVRRLATNGQPVEYSEGLFAIRPGGATGSTK